MGRQRPRSASVASTSMSAHSRRSHSSSHRDEQPSYARLEPRVQKIRETVIREKWKRLPEGSQVRVVRLLDEVARRGLAGLEERNGGGRNKKGKKRGKQAMEEAEEGDDDAAEMEVVADLAHRLTAHLPRLPFPPRTDDRDFDFEGTLHRVRALEAQLTANMHGVALLKAQIKKEEAALKVEQAELESLERSARDARGLRREQRGRLHVLAREDRMGEEGEGGELEDNTALHEAEKLDEALLAEQKNGDGNKDEDAQVLIAQLRSHLESIRANTAGTRGVVDVMEAVQAKMDVFSATCLTAGQYEALHGVRVG